MVRTLVSTGTEWESVVGYSRVVKSGQWIFVSGTTATDQNGRIVSPGDVYAQTRRTLGNIADALKRVNAGMRHVVRTRIFVRNIDQWTDVARAHKEFFGDIKPAASMVEVNRFISEDILVEIEADAILDDD